MKKFLIALILLLCVMAGQAQVKFSLKAGANLCTTAFALQSVNMKLRSSADIGFYVGGALDIPLDTKWSFAPELLYSMEGISVNTDGEKIAGMFDIPSDEVELNALLSGSYNVRNHTHVMRLPVLIKYKSCDGLDILGGVYASMRFTGGFSADSNLEASAGAILTPEAVSRIKNGLLRPLFSDNYSLFDFGFILGAAFTFKNNIFVEARYNFGMLNAFKDKVELKTEDILGPDPGTGIPLKESFSVSPKMRSNNLQLGLGYRF